MRQLIQFISFIALAYAGYELLTSSGGDPARRIYLHVSYVSIILAIITTLMAPSKDSKKYRNKKLKGYIR